MALGGVLNNYSIDHLIIMLMIKKNNFLFSNFCLFVLIIGNCFGQLDQSDINKAIDIPSLEHPYLYFNNTEKMALIQRIENDQESRDVFKA